MSERVLGMLIGLGLALVVGALVVHVRGTGQRVREASKALRRLQVLVLGGRRWRR